MQKQLASQVAVAALLLLLTAAAPAQVLQWKPFNYPQDGFAALFPSQPEVQKKNLATPEGAFELRTYVGSTGDASLFVSVCDYGPASENRSPDQLLLGAKNSALAKSGAILLSESKIALGPNHGLQFEAESSTTHYAARFYIVGSTLYQTLVAFPLNKRFDRTANFLDSFKLISRTPAASAH